MHKLAGFAPLLLAACSTVPAEGAQTTAGAESDSHLCRSEGLSRFVGRERTSETERELLQRSGARTVRWVREGTMITMEFSPERLTVHLDANNSIESLNCG